MTAPWPLRGVTDKMIVVHGRCILPLFKSRSKALTFAPRRFFQTARQSLPFVITLQNVPIPRSRHDAVARAKARFCPAFMMLLTRERLIGSTEVLESCFGKMKEMEKQHSRGGFTILVISFGAMLATTTTEAINAALKHSRVADVHDWCKPSRYNTVRQTKNRLRPRRNRTGMKTTQVFHQPSHAHRLVPWS